MTASSSRPALLAVLATVTFVTLFVALGRYPITAEEAHYAFCGISIAERGVPVYYKSEVEPGMKGIWHPPSYVYALGAAVLVAGKSDLALRLPGLLSVLLSAILLWRIVRQDGDDPWEPALAVILFFLSPLAVHDAMLLDIDNSLLMPALLLVIWLAGPPVSREGPLSSPRAVGCALALCLLIKLSTPLLLPPILLFAAGMRQGWTEATRRLVQTVVIAVFLFVMIFGAYCLISGMPFAMPFHHIGNKLDAAAPAPRTWGPFSGAVYQNLYRLWMAKNGAFWVSPFLLLLALPGSVRAVLRGSDRSRIGALLAWAILGAYVFVGSPPWGFPKYYSAALPLLCWFVARSLLAAARNAPGAVWPAAGAGAVVALALWSRDPFPELLALYRGSERMVVMAAILHYAVPLLLVVTFVTLRPPGPRLAAATLALGGLWLGSSTALLLHQLRADHSTTYAYGDRGLLAVAAHVREVTKPEDVPLIPIDVAYHAGRKFYEPFPSTYGSARFPEILADPRNTLFVHRRREIDDPARFPELEEKIARYFLPGESLGSFIIRRRRTDRTALPRISPPAAAASPGAVGAGATAAGWDPLESTCRHASLSIL